MKNYLNINNTQPCTDLDSPLNLKMLTIAELRTYGYCGEYKVFSYA